MPEQRGICRTYKSIEDFFGEFKYFLDRAGSLSAAAGRAKKRQRVISAAFYVAGYANFI